MEARVSDLGLATLMEPNKTHVSTLVAGTSGYLAPGMSKHQITVNSVSSLVCTSAEFFETGKATMKVDVYSFGVVLLELLTGMKPTDEEFFEEGTKLVTWVKAVVEDKREEYVLDSSLKCSPTEEINKVFRIAFMCLEPEPSKRPTMDEIVKILEQAKSERVVEEY
ncbi:hypothetical protein Peur_061062 [Populus x canadensis]